MYRIQMSPTVLRAYFLIKLFKYIIPIHAHTVTRTQTQHACGDEICTAEQMQFALISERNRMPLIHLTDASLHSV